MIFVPHKALFVACVGLLVAVFLSSGAHAQSVAADFSQDATGGGSIKLGNDTSTCDATHAGAIKYANGLSFTCNGSYWVPFNLANSSTSCSAASRGAIKFESGTSSYTYCNGIRWVDFGQQKKCPSGFVLIPNSGGVDGYADGWCVSKYEMSPYDTSSWTQDSTYGSWSYVSTTNASTLPVAPKVGQMPITRISRNEAATACSSYLKDSTGNTVSNGKLLTVPLWRALILDMTNNPNNWSGGAVGSGYMSRGHANNTPAKSLSTASDAFPSVSGMTSSGGYYWSRTYQTSAGDIIWDIAGNVWEWAEDLHGTDGTTAWTTEFTDGTYSFNGTSLEPPNTAWNSTHGVGKIYDPDGATVGSTYAALFGGTWYDVANAGPWTSSWNGHSPSSGRRGDFGFRCIAPAQ